MGGGPLSTVDPHEWTTLPFRGCDYVTSREMQNFYGFGNLSLAAILLYEPGGYVVTGLPIIGLSLARDRIIPPAYGSFSGW